MNNCRIRRTGTLARRGRTDGQECPSYSRFATVVFSDPKGRGNGFAEPRWFRGTVVAGFARIQMDFRSLG